MRSRNRASAIAIVASLSLVSVASAQRTYDTDILTERFGFGPDTRKSVSLDDLHQGCPEIDCIRSIDDPKYLSVANANHVADDDIVLALSWNGEQRAYPARILDYHEIVNDTIGGTPIAVTWCPLCGSAVGVKREINGEVTEFGVSGILYNSDLVFYDRNSKTLWDQIEAKGIVGPLTGHELELVPVTMTRWGKWKSSHPQTQILSADTGFEIDYSEDHYGKYRDGRRIIFPVSQTDDRVHPKTVVYGFMLDEGPLAFTEASLSNGGLDYESAGRSMRVTMKEDGSVIMSDSGSDERYAPVRLYWFAWYTFHPETDLIQ